MIAELYHNHGTSEQFHSELKSDMCVELLPSDSFRTNRLVLGLAPMAFNFLRCLGWRILQKKMKSLADKKAPMR